MRHSPEPVPVWFEQRLPSRVHQWGVECYRNRRTIMAVIGMLIALLNLIQMGLIR